MASKVTIQKAKARDIEGILEVQNSRLLSSLEGASGGFIVHLLDRREFDGVIQNNSCFLLIALTKERVIGYALAYDLNEWKKLNKKWHENVEPLNIAKQLSPDKTLYFRHIARKKGYEGVGKLLEEKVYALARKQGYSSVIAEIIEKPVLNKLSEKVHKKRGFQKIGQVEYPNGEVWGLYKKEL